MAKTKYIVKLTNEEYERLKTISQSEEESERTILRATILMMSDGLARFVDVFKCYKDYGGIAKLIKEKGADNAFTELRSLERSMRDVSRPSLHDDASFLMLDVRKG